MISDELFRCSNLLTLQSEQFSHSLRSEDLTSGNDIFCPQWKG